MSELPDEIDAVLAGQQAMIERWDYGSVQQSLIFFYEHDGERITLGQFAGPAPVPPVGQTVRLYSTQPLVVDRVETDYEIAEDGGQYVCTSVYVKLPMRASRKW